MGYSVAGYGRCVDMVLWAVYIVFMNASVQAELDKLTELIVQAIPVEQIFLFGSYAYGKPHKDSDLDLYVVLRDDYPPGQKHLL
ncbi:hypothetical protein AGMMS50268_40210 [Spirochaetia bacterium]|nr:hypothetical protein AGMMS50268_40210 [Spirochaetia bacterium]